LVEENGEFEMSETIFVCRICGSEWETLPEGAVQLTTGHGGGPRVYKFKDGSIHVVKVQSTKEQK